MKLSFKAEQIHEKLQEELKFNSYLELFEEHIPFLPSRILSPLSEEEAIKHYKKLEEILKLCFSQKLNLTQLLNLSKKILPLDHLLTSFAQKEHFEQYHLFLLKNYLSLENEILDIEMAYNDNSKSEIALIKSLQKILDDVITPDGTKLKLEDYETQLKSEIYEKDSFLEKALQKHETEIIEATGLHMLFPYPREIISPQEDLLAKVKKCRNLTCSSQGEMVLLAHKLSPEILKQEEEIKALKQRLNETLKNKLSLLFDKILPYSSDVLILYGKRKEKTYQYLFCHCIQKHNLCIPHLIEKNSSHFLRLKKGEFPYLKSCALGNYKPLSLNLDSHGVHVFTGANMSGKTSALKTLFFNLILVKYGLPIPAEKFELAFPHDIQIHLKNSGDIKEGLSAFAHELHFLTQQFSPNSYIFLDEFFHSTHPVAGEKLTNIFFEYFSKKNIFVICSSFYSQIFELSSIKTYKLKENTIEQSFLYEIERIENPKQEIKKIQNSPFKLALTFPFDEELKKEIKKHLDL